MTSTTNAVSTLTTWRGSLLRKFLSSWKRPKSCPGGYRDIAMDAVVKNYAQPANVRPPGAAQWTALTTELLDSKVAWLNGPLWVVTSRGVFAAEYAGFPVMRRYRFYLEAGGTIRFPDVTHAMPRETKTTPTAPPKE